MQNNGSLGLIRHCTDCLITRKLNIQDLVERIHAHDTIFDSLTILANYYDEWHENYKERKGLVPLSSIVARIKHCLIEVPLDWQFCFWRLLETLYGTFDWVKFDEDAADIQDSEISATI